MYTRLPAATTALVDGVVTFLRTPPDATERQERARGLLELCQVALSAASAARTESRDGAPPAVSVPTRHDLGPRIAELRAHGQGVRQIARILGVNPSTVSRRLRRARRD